MKKENAIYFQAREFPEFRFMSNFFLSRFHDLKFTYPSVEHYYQSQKASDPAEALAIMNASSPAVARKLGQLVALGDKWDECKVAVMTNGCRMKFEQNDELKEKLVMTDGFELIEFAPWGDTFWGVDKNYEGQNNLGKILMELRAGFIKERSCG